MALDGEERDPATEGQRQLAAFLEGPFGQVFAEARTHGFARALWVPGAEAAGDWRLREPEAERVLLESWHTPGGLLHLELLAGEYEPWDTALAELARLLRSAGG